MLMNPRPFLTLALVALLLLAGVWLLGRAAAPSAESPLRRDWLRQLGPVGQAVPEWPAEVAAQVPVTPTLVSLDSLPPAAGSGDTPFEQWQRGEIDAFTMETAVSDVELALLRTEALRLEPELSIHQQSIGPAVNAPVPTGAGFEGPDFTQCCGGGGGGITPPDPELAVGPTHVIAAVNVSFAIYNKSGGLLYGPLPFTTLFASVPGCQSGLFDPNIVYDESADRFLFGLDGGGHHYCVAVSRTSNPLGQWYLYPFPTGQGTSGIFFDYPQAGIGRDALYIGANLFDMAAPGDPPFIEGRIWAFRKSELYAGVAADVATCSVGDYFTPQPIQLHGYIHNTWPTSGPHYFFGLSDFDNASGYALISWGNPFGSPCSALGYQPVNLNGATPAFGHPVAFPQFMDAGLSASLDWHLQANDVRILDFEYRNGYGWLSQSVACNPGSGTVDCLRWAQISLPGGGVVQAGIYGTNGDHRTFPDLAVNHCGDMAIGYTKSNRAIYPSIYVTGRRSGDPAGKLQGERLLRAGEVTYLTSIGGDPPPRRWGDYTAMTIDPNGLTFWYIGEYSKNTQHPSGRWGTFIGSYSYPTCASPVVFDNHLYMPLVANNAATPVTGRWADSGQSPTREFLIQAAGAQARDYSLLFTVAGCGSFKVTLPGPFPITDGHFAFDQGLFAYGQFIASNQASGVDGLDHVYISQCNAVVSVGSARWTASPQSGAAALRSARVMAVVSPGSVENPSGLVVTPLDD
jgi:hypothetical protein